MPPTRFLSRLEALRGVAALMVAMTHSMGGIKVIDPTVDTLKAMIGVIANGGAGVSMFFVLSGYVLGLSLARDGEPIREWPAFLWRRVLRIYPAMIVSLLFCWFWLNNIFDFTVRYDAAAAIVWNREATWQQFLLHLVFLDNYLNMVVWTLQVEMLGSIVFPLLFFIKMRSRTAGVLMLAAWIAYFLLTPLYSYWRSGFVFMFIVGLFVPEIDAWMQRHFTRSWHRPVVALLAFLACNVSSAIWDDSSPRVWVLYAFTACVLVAALAGIPREQHVAVLDWRVTRWLGRISYSFYLWHLPVLIIFGSWMLKHGDNSHMLAHPLAWSFLVVVVTVPIAACVAHLSYLFFEKPFKGSGRLVRSGEAVLRGGARATPAATSS